jgi:hypothetical protein
MESPYLTPSAWPCGLFDGRIELECQPAETAIIFEDAPELFKATLLL